MRAGRLVAAMALLVVVGCGGDGGTDLPEMPERITPGGGVDRRATLAELEPFGSFGETAVEITDPDGTTTCACVLVADEGSLRSRGLMGVTDLHGYAGMLFIWDEDTTSRFFMRDTPMPLSIAWYTAGGDFVSSADMEPCADEDGCPRYSADGAYRFALEVPQGDLADLGAVTGSSIEIVADCGPPTP